VSLMVNHYILRNFVKFSLMRCGFEVVFALPPMVNHLRNSKVPQKIDLSM
jgi:hypothetical protein